MAVADIQQGIVNKIAETFPNITIYTEKVPQNFVEPSFRIKAMPVINTPGTWTRRYRSVQFDILYFPESELSPESEWNNIQEQLFDNIEYITAEGDLMRGEEMNADYDSEQQVGHFRITFGFFLLGNNPGDKMEDLYQPGCEEE